ncbi:MAG TPA: hypothetical protein VFV65_00075 [Gemmatimonadales bacterium]|nr:hypothetical protein [Gemmatimonadales bacterium]
MDRPTPFELVFADLAPDRFPALRDALAAAEANPADRDAFLLTLPAMQLLRELRPDDSEAGAGVDELAALLHHAYLHWDGGCRTTPLSADEVAGLLAGPGAGASTAGEAVYLQLPERRVWASLIPGGPWEPLDGCFVHDVPGGGLRVLGVFGLHPSRDGFTVAEAVGRPGTFRGRADGTAAFAPTLEGGAAAGLHAVVDAEELVELAARVLARQEIGAAPPEEG